MTQVPLTVTQFTQVIKQQLESTFRVVLLQGEISNFTRQASSGHLYFSLKDAHAQIGAIMFRTDALHLTPPPKAGDHVVVKGEMSVYPPQGSYKIIVRELYYVGIGALLMKFEQLKIKLQSQGWFSQERKKALPKFPKKIGVVTSPTGAVIQDMLNILNKRFPGFHLILNPVRVQGEGAAAEIAGAIQFFNEHKLVDVIIVARGGGSLEDLWPFNEEIVAGAIFKSAIPIISAVGHETDFSLSDFVADVRAPTPTAAAQIVIPEKSLVLEYLFQSKRRMQHTLKHLIKQQSHRLYGLTRHPIFSSPAALLGVSIQKLDGISQSLDHSVHNALQRKRLKLTALSHQMKGLQPAVHLATIRRRLIQLDKAINAAIKQKKLSLENQKEYLRERLNDQLKAQLQKFKKMFNEELMRRKMNQNWKNRQEVRTSRLQNLIENLHSVDPRTLLQKGYSILFSEKDNSLIISAKDLHANQDLKAYLSDGTALLSVKEVKINSKGVQR